MTPEVLAAIIASATSFILAVVSVLLAQRQAKLTTELEKTKAELSRIATEDRALLDYKYEARKRLYTELQPHFFQLSEAADSAYARIEGLATTAANGNLGQGANWLYSGYYSSSTVYRLCSPLVNLRLAQQRLTSLDLSVEPGLRNQYKSARLIHATWRMSRELAQAEPSIRYEPGGLKVGQPGYDLRVHGYQHIVIGHLEQVLDMMTVRDEDNIPRCMSYADFERGWDDQDSPRSNITGPIWNLFSRFHPAQMPVLWRTLLVQAHLFRALSVASESDIQNVAHPAEAIPEAEWSRFDWRPADHAETYDQAVVEPFVAARAFLRKYLQLSH